MADFDDEDVDELDDLDDLAALDDDAVDADLEEALGEDYEGLDDHLGSYDLDDLDLDQPDDDLDEPDDDLDEPDDDLDEPDAGLDDDAGLDEPEERDPEHEAATPGTGSGTVLVEDDDLLDDLDEGPVTAERDLDVDDEVREGEFVCRSCFMAKRDSALADEENLLCRDCV